MKQYRMSQEQSQERPGKAESMERLILEDGRYPLDAFGFLNDGLMLAVKKVHGEKPGPPGQRHVSGRQLCQSLRDLALHQWGLLARTVLRRWNVNATLDFGNMVYLLVENGFMQKTAEDSLEDFRDVYDFDEAFRVQPTYELKDGGP